MRDLIDRDALEVDLVARCAWIGEDHLAAVLEVVGKMASETYSYPVFMKESLRGLMGDDFRQEFPWEV